MISVRHSIFPITVLSYYLIRDFTAPITTDEIKKEYDYIIVGAGSSGSVIANRLSEDSKVTVLLLEAGGNEPPFASIPLIAPYLQGTPIDWNYATEPQENACLGFERRRCVWPRGKGLGGSSLINYMLYVRGNRNDYDNWARNGARGWSWEDVFPYFLKSEHNTDPHIVKNGYHGTNGYQYVSTTAFITPLAEAFIESGKHFNYQDIDINGPRQTGFTIPQGTTRGGMRYSVNRAYLDPAKHRKNLNIVIFALVTKILFDTEKNARAVQFDRLNRHYIVHARKEIIISAGAVNTPQLLLLSGIGPKEHLKQHGIPTIADLPVGLNLQDHYGPFSLNFLIDKPSSYSRLAFSFSKDVPLYLFGKTGPMRTLGADEGLGFIHTHFNNESIDNPDSEIHFSSQTLASDGGRFAKHTGQTDEVWNAVFKPFSFYHSFLMFPVLLHPRSRGYIALRSANPYDPPIIDPKYFSDPQDLATLVDAMKVCLALADTPAFEKFNARQFPTTYPGCEHYNRFSDEYLACTAKVHTQTAYHPAGTCKMGALDDPTTVLDPELRVKGIPRLRVADASIMPQIVSANLNAPCIMIGEKASDLIKKDYSSIPSLDI